jgi:hypothetical protein
MGYLFSYVLRYDDGAAPNPFWGICTLTICKPAIRRTAEIGDWVIGTGSKNSKINIGKTHDFSDSIVYAMKVTDKKSLADYDEFCIKNLPDKIPKWFDQDWRKRMGDCIYDFSSKIEPTIRKGVHIEANRDRDISGQYSLLSNQFYYFGGKALPLPKGLKGIIKKNQGHLKIEKQDIIETFEHWIQQFEKNKILGDPQLKHEFDKVPSDEHSIRCSTRDLEDDKYEGEEKIC